jgi:hypothetical protein
MEKKLHFPKSHVSAVLFALFIGVTSASAQPWKFGVMSDTQWIGTDDGKNPNTVAVGIVRQLNHEFIKRGVKFVIQVGDLVDQTGSTPASIAQTEDTRASYAQELYNAGIGFFPLRGNHDSNKLAGAEFKRIYPQTLNGMMDMTPSDVFSVANPDASVQPFPAPAGKHFTVGSNFSTPDPSMTGNLDWIGSSYSFDYHNARFVLLNQFTPLNSSVSTPALTFVKAETFGYSLNGQEFQVCQYGQLNCNNSYTQVADSYNGTTARILDGLNKSTVVHFDNRNLIKTVDAGWTPRGDFDDLASEILTLWGMGDLRSPTTDVYVLSMSYDDKRVRPIHQGDGGFGIATRGDDGDWTNAVDKNIGGPALTFVMGPWNPMYGLGTYGVDPSTETAWAVINYDGDFAVSRNIEPVPGKRNQ